MVCGFEHKIAETIALDASIKARRPWSVLHHAPGLVRHLNCADSPAHQVSSAWARRLQGTRPRGYSAAACGARLASPGLVTRPGDARRRSRWRVISRRANAGSVR